MTENDFDRTARLWLEDGPTVMSDRALQAALDEIHVTRQSRPWWPARRFSRMNNPMRFAIAAAAVVMAAVVGINVLPGGTSGSAVGGGPATPTPAPIPLDPGQLTVPAPGVYLAGTPFPIPITMTVPAGWVGNVGGPYAAFLDKGPADASGGAAIAFSLSQKLYADPCSDGGFLAQQPGPTVDDLATALSNLRGITVTAPTDVNVDGYSGKQLTLTAPVSFKCTLSPDGYAIWQLPLGAIFSLTPGERMVLWILDVNGQRLVVSAETYPATTAQDQAEAQAILNSVHITTVK